MITARGWRRLCGACFCAFAIGCLATPMVLAEGSQAIAAAPAAIDPTLGVPTHKQVQLLSAKADGESPLQVSCFCLTADNGILVAGAANCGEVREWDSEGHATATWKLPVNPEAIFARADGTVLVAGEGKVLKLSAKGEIELQKDAPHMAELKENPEKIRAEIIAQAKQRAELLSKQGEVFQKRIDMLEKSLATMEEQLAELKKEAEKNASQIAELEKKIALQRRQQELYSKAKVQWDNNKQSRQPAELTEEQIEAQVKATIAYKQKASSICANGDEVFLATRAAEGYAYVIWRMDDSFENAAVIVKDLRGCCGQMDVKANDKGVFVAENGRHRVCRYDREGKEVCTWGFGSRTGFEGFGSCCNPMNVAFGPGDVVYTAEDDTGRVKRYSADGKLLGIVGAVDLKPGCKNVSIAVSSDGKQVYMLDITRNQLARLEARPADEVAADREAAKTAPQANEAKPKDAEAAATAPVAAPARATTARLLLRGLQLKPIATPAKEDSSSEE